MKLDRRRPCPAASSFLTEAQQSDDSSFAWQYNVRPPDGLIGMKIHEGRRLEIPEVPNLGLKLPEESFLKPSCHRRLCFGNPAVFEIHQGVS